MIVESAPRESLVRALDKLLGGELPIGAFIQWFNSVQWDDLIEDDSDSLRAIWGIENILYQIQDFPETFDRDLAREQLRGEQELLKGDIENQSGRLRSSVQTVSRGFAESYRITWATEHQEVGVIPVLHSVRRTLTGAAREERAMHQVQ